MRNPTPGQICYEAYWRSTNPRLRGYPWETMEPGKQAHWEAAAQAVLVDGRSHARALVQHWHAWHRDAQAPALPLLTAMQALEAWLAQQDTA